VFLRRPEEIRWSPNLNCLIGSRGTGKSTLLDYIRLALDRLRREDLDLPASLITEVEDRVRDTLTSTARIEVELETRGGVYQVVYSSSEVGMGRRLVFPVGAELPDPHLDVRALFPCRILSQHQIDHSVSRRDRAALRKFLDDFIRCRLDELERKGQDLKGKIGQIDAALAAKTESQKRRPALETEQRDLMGRLEGQKRLREALPYWQGVEMESDFFERLFVELEEVVSTWRGRLEDLELKSTLISEDLRTTPDAALIAEAAGVADTAVQRLREAIENDLRVFEHIFRAENSALLSLHRERWLPLFVEYRRRLEAAQAEAGVRETSVQAITEMSRRLLTLRAELAALDQEQRQIAQLEVERQAVLKGLRQVWREQTEARLSKAQELMDRLRPGPGRRPYVEIRVEHQADRDEFVKVLSLKIPDKRRLNEDDIRSLVDRLAGEGFANVPPPERFIVEARGGERSQILKEVLIQDRRREAFRGIFTESVLRQLETERIPDFVMYYVYRKDGTLAGPIDKVSAGQQGTAILNLLLAAGDEPLIVDTPEEGLDNEGVYAELVPLFRSAKEKRQIIVVTHNANLPVNADAEAIVALEAAGFVEDGTLSQILDGSGPVLNSDQRRHLASLIRWPDWETKVRHYLGRKQGWPTTVVERVVAEIGRVRQAEGRLKRLESVSPPVAVGALDAPAVKRAVQDIMEGSEEAFRRRQEKYGF
jgi:energy-coupling factor transporter ATP-binding protein EcfA2